MALLDTIDLLPSDVSIGDVGHEQMHDHIHVGLKDLKTVYNSLNSATVKITTDQSIGGAKTFTSSPIVPSPTADSHSSTKKYVDDAVNTRFPKTGGTVTGNIQVVSGAISTDSSVSAGSDISTLGNLNASGSGRFQGPYGEATSTRGVYTGVVSATPRILFADGNNSLNWQIDNSGGVFRWFLPGQEHMKLSASSLDVTGKKIVNVGTPTAASDVANKSYVDGAIASGGMTLNTAQTVTGVKTFQSSPRLSSTSTAGYAWVASDNLGNGGWVALTSLAAGGTVPWANVTGKPATFDNNGVTTAGRIEIAQRPEADQHWHDNFVFGRHLGWPTVEKRTSGVWSADTLNRNLFINKEATPVEIIAASSTTDALRWRWTSGNLAFSGICSFVFGVSFTGTARTVEFIIESSTDGTNWVERGRQSTTGSATVVYIDTTNTLSMSNASTLRITAQRTSGTGEVRLNCIRALSLRKGDQGGGIENTFPYDWDSNRKIIVEDLQVRKSPTVGQVLVATDVNGNLAFSSSAPISAGQLNNSHISNTANIDGAKIADLSIGSSKFVAGSVINSAIAAKAVTAEKIDGGPGAAGRVLTADANGNTSFAQQTSLMTGWGMARTATSTTATASTNSSTRTNAVPLPSNTFDTIRYFDNSSIINGAGIVAILTTGYYNLEFKAILNVAGLTCGFAVSTNNGVSYNIVATSGRFYLYNQVTCNAVLKLNAGDSIYPVILPENLSSGASSYSIVAGREPGVETYFNATLCS